MTKRLNWIDVAKGILIILVIMGHTHINYYSDFIINAFHMAAFFILSGMTFKADYKITVFFKKQIKGLLLPYIIFCIIILVYFSLRAYIFHDAFSIMSGLKSIVLPISGRDTTSVYGLWFFPCLFFAKLTLYLCIKAWNYKKPLSILLASGIIILCLLINKMTDTISVISLLPITTFYLLLGYLIATKAAIPKLKKLSNIYIYIVTCVFFLSLYANYYYTPYAYDYSSFSFGILPLYIIHSVAGSFIIFFIAIKLKNIKVLQNIGKDSIYYYGLHYEVLPVLKEILSKLPFYGANAIIAVVLTTVALYIINILRRKLI